VRACLELFGTLTGWHIPISFMLQREFWALVVMLFFAGAVLSGFIAIILSSFKPRCRDSKENSSRQKRRLFAQGIGHFQFVASVVLISGSLIVYQQLNFMKIRTSDKHRRNDGG